MAQFKDFDSLFKGLQQAAESIKGKYGLSDILTDKFVSLNTSFSTFEELIEQAPIEIKDEMDDNEIQLLNDYIASNSNYSDWEEILVAAGTEFTKDQLKKIGFF